MDASYALALLVVAAVVVVLIVLFWGDDSQGFYADPDRDAPGSPWGIIGGGIFGRATAPAYAVDSSSNTISVGAPRPKFNSDYLMTVWWADPADKPQWTTYTFGGATDQGTVPAICSTTLRVARDNGRPETCIFVGTGSEHFNMLLRANVVVGASVGQAGTLINFINWTGLNAMPDPKASVYCCIAFDPAAAETDNTDGIDDLILGRDDGIWYLRARRHGPLGFGSAKRTTYEATWLGGAPPSRPDAVPLVICISRSIAPGSSIYEGTKKFALDERNTSRIWSSFFIAPGSLRIGSARGHNFHIPTPGALSTRIGISANGMDVTYHGVVGRFSTTEPSKAEMVLPAKYLGSTYAFRPPHRGAAILDPVAIGAAMEESASSTAPSRDQAAIDALASSVAMGDKAVPQHGSDDTNGSHHIRSREGGMSDRTARPTEGYNHLESRKIMADAYRESDRKLRKNMGRQFRPCIVTTSGFNPLDPGTLAEPALRKMLLLGRPDSFFLRGFGAGMMNVMVKSDTAAPKLYNASGMAQIAVSCAPTTLELGSTVVNIALLRPLLERTTVEILLG